MAAMETLLNMLPLDIFIKGVARMGAYRLNATTAGGTWNTETPE
jgi:hypothetical protein